ncbi:MAG: polymerase subunit epsilon [Chitinophagaceae bacterium]|nr:polymerase subunit epsilon [Chitinophagaceae bacterium]
MLYAIVDIETTGGYAAAGGITEVAVVITDGEKIIDRFETLINPVYTIPRYVESLTGITNAMVEDARHFKMVAGELYELLCDKIFVAHNVNFDYSYLKYHFKEAGYELDCKKLCTIRLGRQILPGYKSYSLGNFCREIGIPIEQRHRAGGDADATVKLFHHLLQKDTNSHIQNMLKVKSKEQHLPPNLPAKQIKQLPQNPGVYYFHDNKGKVIYVGKAKNLSKRVNSHFANNKPGKQKQEFLRNIHSITYKTTATELMAFILESTEIKKFWPDQNRSLKRFEQAYALYSFEDRNGYLRLAIEKKNKNIKPLYTFNLLVEGHNLLRKLSHQFQLCPKLCFLQHDNIECEGRNDGRCVGSCDKKESPEEYNRRVTECIEQLHKELPTFALVDYGLNVEEQSCILMEKGRFYGMGYLPSHVSISGIDDLKNYITPYSENDYIRGLVYQHAVKFPHKKIALIN